METGGEDRRTEEEGKQKSVTGISASLNSSMLDIMVENLYTYIVLFPMEARCLIEARPLFQK